MANNPGNVRAVVEAGALPRLSELLSSGTPEAWEWAAYALGHAMANNTDNQRKGASIGIAVGPNRSGCLTRRPPHAPACAAAFTWRRRRHHCWCCGALVCDECSSRVVTWGGGGSERVVQRVRRVPAVRRERPLSPRSSTCTTSARCYTLGVAAAAS